MSWSKRYIFIVLTIVFFNGCADDIAKSMVVGAVGNVGKHKYDLDGDKPLFLEAVDNEEFKDFLLEKNIIEGLKEEDIVYIDNRNNFNNSHPYSYKTLIAKDKLYFIGVDSWQNWTRLNSDNYKEFDYDVKKISFKKWNIKTEISDKELILMLSLKEGAKSYEYITNALYLIGTPVTKRRPFNNLEKTKEIIDERVSFYKNKDKEDKADKGDTDKGDNHNAIKLRKVGKEEF